MAGLAAVACGSSGGGVAGNPGGRFGGNGSGSRKYAYVIPAATCTLSGSSVSIAGVEVLISTNRTIANACGQASNACVSYANVAACPSGS